MIVQEVIDRIDKYNIPMDAEVFIERVEDIYFEDHWWKTKKKYDPYIPEKPTEYIKPFSCCKYKRDKNLYIDCHY